MGGQLGEIKELIEISENLVRLKRGEYNETTLVDKICTDTQKRSYHRKDKFASGKHQSMFLDTLARYCEYEYDAEKKKYIVTDVFSYPKSLSDAKIHKGIYQYLAPLILYRVLYGDESKKRKATITSMDLAAEISIINKNYNTMKFNQDAVNIDMQIPQQIVSEYFNKADNRIDDYIRQCIKYLVSMNCIIYNETHMIATMPEETEVDGKTIYLKPGEIRRATDEEMKLYSKLVEKASRKAGIRNSSEKWYGKKAAKYNSELTSLLEQNKIWFVCRAFELWKSDTQRCKETLKSFSDMTISQREKEIGLVLKLILDTNAENRAGKKQMCDNYIEHFKNLSDITLNPEAKDVRDQLPSANKKSYQEKAQEKYGYQIVYLSDEQ